MDASEWDARYASTLDLEWGTGPNAWIAEQVTGLTPGRALDLGTGEGRNALYLAPLGWHVTALDFSAAGLEKGRRAERDAPGPVPVTWLCADVTAWKPRAGSADLVLLAYLHLSADI